MSFEDNGGCKSEVMCQPAAGPQQEGASGPRVHLTVSLTRAPSAPRSCWRTTGCWPGPGPCSRETAIVGCSSGGALLDAVKAVGIPTVEVHISRVEEREDFRQISYIRLACVKTITGHGTDGYLEAIDFLAEAEL